MLFQTLQVYDKNPLPLLLKYKMDELTNGNPIFEQASFPSNIELVRIDGE